MDLSRSVTPARHHPPCSGCSPGFRAIALRCAIAAAAVAVVGAVPGAAAAQELAAPAADTLGVVTVYVRHDARPLARALVAAVGERRDGVAVTALANTNAEGVATLRLPPAEWVIVASPTGFGPDTARLSLRPGQDTSIVFQLEPRHAVLERVVVTATRGERRVEDTPLRVEVIDEEEIAEKVAMSPGDIAMLLNETGGLRVQATNPSLGGAGVRVQGLRTRHTLLLADGLPLYGGQAGGLGLLQIPPVDLARVEVIKGSASALHGSSALGGVINLVSRRPAEESAHTALVNQTSRGGSDGVLFATGPLSPAWGYTMLAGGHRQRQDDLDGDGWTDLPGYERVVLRPRLHHDDGSGRSAFLTVGITAEDREGGTVDGGNVPGGGSYLEALRTRRFDAGALARWVVTEDGALAGMPALHGSILTFRGSAMEQRHAHRFGAVREDDRHRTWFAEAALATPRSLGGTDLTYVLGAAVHREVYRALNLAGFDYGYTVPGAFAQVDLDPAPWVALSASTRVDRHGEQGTFLNPRVSVLLRRFAEEALADWTVRLSGGTGVFAPTPFTEETEATGLTPLLPITGLVPERARSASLDVGGPVQSGLGALELNATVFGSRVEHPLQLRDADGVTAGGARRVALRNAPEPTRSWGAELLLRLVRELGETEGEDEEEAAALRVTATYAYLRSTECDPASGVDAAGGCGGARREVPLTPRHAAGMVASVERHEHSRVGVELYYTGRQVLDDNPYLAVSPPYLIVGLMGERAIATRAGVARLFLNLENLTNVRQTREHPLLRPERGSGGRWTTDSWTELAGFTVNGGVRLAF